jgi:hypothetical protein
VQAETPREVSLDQLAEGMVLARDLVNRDNAKLLLKGQAVSRASLRRLRMFAAELGVDGAALLVTPGHPESCVAPAPQEQG